ncbi:hypothetical protein ATE84_3812 [Aquimarina sp. MAR_2010_214]|uniref:hypothetical protein n=1 Tax=Aquimarina sp. MAR_2010_214 TaxID=1250026 RepID=UPI000C714B11|nr:hypothetical protein [Aquimarina sp. MAR_2010_214]PKV51714.1 hypothetical protein ATE84_3812 [Aquimarina sp. MAR_2010_214]
MKNKFLKIIKRILITILILFVVVYISNEIVYKTSIPENFVESNWNGQWNSSEYALVSGKVLTTIPENNNAEFKSETLIYYNLWSLYKPGQNKIVELSGNFSESDINGNSTGQKRRPNESNAYHRRFFKAKISIGNGQFIKYDGMKDNDGIEISGDYDSSFPKDKGTFELNKQ